MCVSHSYIHFVRYIDATSRCQELTYIIKQDIANINKQIAALQSYVKQRNAQNNKSPEGKQLEEHNHNVVMLLQSKLADTSMTFKDVLEIRTQVSVHLATIFIHSSSYLSQNMKESKDRTEQFMSSTSAAANQAPSSASTYTPTLISLTHATDSLLFGNAQRQQDPMGDGTASSPRLDTKGKGRAQPSSDILALDLGAAEEGQGSATGDAFMQMQLVEQQVRLYGVCYRKPTFNDWV